MRNIKKICCSGNITGARTSLRQRALLCAALTLAAGGQLAHSAPAPAAQQRPAPVTAPKAPRPALDFTLPGTDGQTHSLASYRGHPIALFFYCGCERCQRCAEAWGAIQRSGTLGQPAPAQAQKAPSQTALTLVVFHGPADEVRDFAATTQLDPRQTVLLANPEEKISALYQADPCPRVFVVDGHGLSRYTNDEAGESSYKIPAPLIVARTVDAIRAVAATPKATVTAKAGKINRQPKRHK